VDNHTVVCHDIPSGLELLLGKSLVSPRMRRTTVLPKHSPGAAEMEILVQGGDVGYSLVGLAQIAQ